MSVTVEIQDNEELSVIVEREQILLEVETIEFLTVSSEKEELKIEVLDE